VDIAYWTIGEGPLIVQTPLLPYSHIEMEWQVAELREWYLNLADEATLVRYDGRGNGLSERDVTDVTLEAHVRDLDAVVTAVGSGPATVIGVFHSGPAAIAYAARHPERVARLVLWCTYAAGSDYWSAAQSEGLRSLRQTDYRLFLRTAAHELIGWDAGQQTERFSGLMLGAVEPAVADRLIAATRDFDVRAELNAIDCPTLVIHRRQLDWLDISLSRKLASAIRGARLSVVEGTSPLPGAGETESAVAAIDEFLGRHERRSLRPADGAVRTILFTDLADHTALMSRLGDVAGRALLREHEAVIRAALGEHHGTEVKALGDGLMASFESVTNAVACAVAIQRGIRAWNLASGRSEDSVSVRVGLQAGAPIEESGDLFGGAVIAASRITAYAAGGEIIAGNTVRELCIGRQFTFHDRGDFIPKGFDEAIRVWEVGWRD
jgi:class 3 adenylate cyclase